MTRPATRPTTCDDLVLTPRGLRFRGRLLPCTRGRNGLTALKREGDGRTPQGAHRITAVLHRPDRLRGQPGWRPIRPGDQWSDDPADPLYNRPVRASRHSHERLRRPDPLYDLVLVTDWNAAGAPGRGSAIFLHRWRRPGAPTAGCVALSPRDLRWVAERVTARSRLVVR